MQQQAALYSFAQLVMNSVTKRKDPRRTFFTLFFKFLTVSLWLLFAHWVYMFVRCCWVYACLLLLSVCLSVVAECVCPLLLSMCSSVVAECEFVRCCWVYVCPFLLSVCLSVVAECMFVCSCRVYVCPLLLSVCLSVVAECMFVGCSYSVKHPRVHVNKIWVPFITTGVGS